MVLCATYLEIPGIGSRVGFVFSVSSDDVSVRPSAKRSALSDSEDKLEVSELGIEMFCVLCEVIRAQISFVMAECVAHLELSRC